MEEVKRNDDELFAALNKARKKKRRKKLLTVLIIVVLVVIGLMVAFSYLRARVEESLASSTQDVLRYEVGYGSVSTRVAGSGTIRDVDTEEITVPAGVEIDEVLVEANTRIRQGEIIARVDTASVLSALADIQETINDLDKQLASAAKDAVSTNVTAGAAGRVKKLYIDNGTDVAACMVENGALAVISLDGYMAVDIQTDMLSGGETVSAVREDGSSIAGKVDLVIGDKATILVTDNGPRLDEQITVRDAEGTELGKGTLYVHNPLRVIGFTGTVSAVSARENQSVYANSAICRLKDTSYSARYDSILKQRHAAEETLMELLALGQNGALLAPFDGTVLTVEYGNESDGQDAASAQMSAYGGSAVEASRSSTDGTVIVTMSRDEQMEVTISVDEADILSLQLGQTAEVTISSIGENTTAGKVTEIDKTASSSSGVTAYSAVVTFEKAANMLNGMTADVVINIEGTENVLILPADAVHRTSAISFVYTDYDEENGVFGGMHPIETGISNDEFVELLSGLQAGDVVYYTEKETAVGFAFGGGFGGGPGSGMQSGGRQRGNTQGGRRPSFR